VRRFQHLIDKLPLAHQFLLLYLLDLLHLFAANSVFTRMDSANLASVFTPGMLSRVDMQPSEYKQSQQVVKFLIDNQTLFSMPKANTARSPSPPPNNLVVTQPPPPMAIEPAALEDNSPTRTQSPPTREGKKPADEETTTRPNKTLESTPRPKHLPHVPSRHTDKHEPDTTRAQPMPHYRRSTTWLPPSHKPLEGVDIDAAKAAAAIRSGHLLPNERRKVKGLARSKTVPSKRPKYGPDDPLQVVHVNRGSSVRERKPDPITEL
jgi:hypothetical protein